MSLKTEEFIPVRHTWLSPTSAHLRNSLICVTPQKRPNPTVHRGPEPKTRKWTMSGSTNWAGRGGEGARSGAVSRRAPRARAEIRKWTDPPITCWHPSRQLTQGKSEVQEESRTLARQHTALKLDQDGPCVLSQGPRRRPRLERWRVMSSRARAGSLAQLHSALGFWEISVPALRVSEV